MSIGRRSFGKNQLLWLTDGPGAHGADPRSPGEVELSLSGAFRFVQESDGQSGLRRPQLGALHAILAYQSTESFDPITIVLPTGTGKTETMLAAFSHQPQRTLVVVPSDSLRTQIAEKFVTLGVLPSVKALEGDFLTPSVALLRAGLSSAEDAQALLENSNVVVATAAALTRSTPEAMEKLVDLTDQLFIDEAHHVPARTWQTISELFSKKPVVQFTATPFREDGKHLDGRIAYSYPLRLAQNHGYFSKIEYRSITAFRDRDRVIAEAAISRLREDLAADRDHIMMARVQTIARADELVEMYQELASDLNPVRVDSKMPITKQRAALSQLMSRESRIVVCVDMLGEGFDLPALKVAAIHDPHKSLAVTLQFVGRFTRASDQQLGTASVFVPRQSGDIDERLRKLYGEDSDWNEVLTDLTQAEVEQEQERSDFETGFQSLPSEISIRSLQPKMSTVVYKSPNLTWNPYGIYDVFPEDKLLTKRIAINEQQQVAWFVSEEVTPVPWGTVESITEVTHQLYVVHVDQQAGLMYINSSNNDSLHEALAKTIGGDDVELIRGDVVYRVLSPIQRRIPTNIGLLDAVSRNRRFSMHVGADVLEGFGPTAAQKSKTNIFAHGYMNNAHVSFGASRKGRVWSHRVAPTLLDWVNWAREVGSVLNDDSIDLASVMSGFIVPRAATSRPALVPLGIEWPHDVVATSSEARQIRLGESAHALIDVDLALTEWSAEGPIKFQVRSADWTVDYEMGFSTNGPVITSVGPDAQIVHARRTENLAEFMSTTGMTVYFEQEALLSPDGYIIQPDRTRPRYSLSDLEDIDWSGVDIRKESQGQTRESDSVQFRVAEVLQGEDTWEVVIDDDGPGEVADLVFLKREEHELKILLVHCKYSSGDQPGTRVVDLYEVCGQAAKNHKSRSEIEIVLRKLIRRESRRQSAGGSGLILGDEMTLLEILDEARLLDPRVTVVVAQPGLSKAAMSQPQSELLACTQLYLSETYGSGFRVLCSP
jgi:superfamily II DNA or RNA helicase